VFNEASLNRLIVTTLFLPSPLLKGSPPSFFYTTTRKSLFRSLLYHPTETVHFKKALLSFLKSEDHFSLYEVGPPSTVGHIEGLPPVPQFLHVEERQEENPSPPPYAVIEADFFFTLSLLLVTRRPLSPLCETATAVFFPLTESHRECLTFFSRELTTSFFELVAPQVGRQRSFFNSFLPLGGGAIFRGNSLLSDIVSVRR